MVDVIELTRDELKVCVREGVTEALIMLGVEADQPLEMQKDFQHLRDWRRASESARKMGMKSVITIMIAGAFGLLWLGITTKLGQ